MPFVYPCQNIIGTHSGLNYWRHETQVVRPSPSVNPDGHDDEQLAATELKEVQNEITNITGM